MFTRRSLLCWVLCAAAGSVAGQTSSSPSAPDDGPSKGVVWRGCFNVQPPQGLQDGDVITAVNGAAIDTYQDWMDAGDKNVRLTCWRKGQGEFTLQVGVTPGIRSACPAWPDWLEEYARYGHQGPWTAKVLSSLRGRLSNSPSAGPVLVEAWSQGCRDPLVASIILRDYREFGRIEDATQVWNDLVKGDKTTYPGGLYRYGVAPYYLTLIRLAYGQASAAKEDLSQLRKEATQAGANRGAALLRCAEVHVLFQASPSDLVAFWTEHAQEIRQELWAVDCRPIRMLADQLQRQGDPNAALAFLAKEPRCGVRDSMITYFKQQLLNSVATKDAPLAAHWALVDWRDVLGPVFTASDHYDYIQFGLASMPCRLAVETRLSRWEKIRSVYGKWAAIVMPTTAGDGDALSAYLFAVTPLSVEYLKDSVKHEILLRLVDPNEWHRVVLDCQQGQFQAEADGISSGPIHRPTGVPLSVHPFFRACGCTAEFRNIRFFVGSDQAVNNDPIEASLRAFRGACKADDLPAARKAIEGLKSSLGPIPAAKAALDGRLRELDALESIHSDSGLGLCTEDWLRWGMPTHPSWSLADGGLVCRGETRPLLAFSLPVADVEITGEMEFHEPDGNAFAVVSWNSFGGVAPLPRLRIRPRSGKVTLFAPSGTVEGSVVVNGDTVPFCIRTRDKAVVAFVASPIVPAVRLSDITATGDRVTLGGYLPSDDGTIRFANVRIRALAKDKRIDAPASFKSVSGSPSSRPAPREDSGDSGG